MALAGSLACLSASQLMAGHCRIVAKLSGQFAVGLVTLAAAAISTTTSGAPILSTPPLDNKRHGNGCHFPQLSAHTSCSTSESIRLLVWNGNGGGGGGRCHYYYCCCTKNSIQTQIHIWPRNATTG